MPESFILKNRKCFGFILMPLPKGNTVFTCENNNCPAWGHAESDTVVA